MRVGLFIPCYIDQLYPDVGLATVEVLERHGVRGRFPARADVLRPADGQYGLRRGYAAAGREVLPDLSRTTSTLSARRAVACRWSVHITTRTWPAGRVRAAEGQDLRVVRVSAGCAAGETIEGRFPYRVGLHNSCHGHRELRLGASSELVVPIQQGQAVARSRSKASSSLNWNDPTNAVASAARLPLTRRPSRVMMGRDRVHDHEQAGTQVLTAADMSCLMHMERSVGTSREPLSRDACRRDPRRSPTATAVAE